MNTRMRNSILALTLLVALLLTTGCTIGNNGLSVNIQNGQVTASVRIGQQAVNNLIVRASEKVQVDHDDFVKEVHGVDFVAPDIIRIDGVFRLPDGGTTSGTIDFKIAAAAGTIKLEVAAVDADGISMDTPAISELNDAFAREFAKDVRGQRNDGDARVVDVTVTDDALQVTVSGPLSN